MSVIRMNLLKRLPIILMVMLLTLSIAPAMVSAQDAPVEDQGDVVDDGDVSEDDAVENEDSAFQNPAQAQKAENVANAAALDSDDGELADRVDALEAAEQELADSGLNSGDEGYQELVDAVEDAEQDVADRLSEISGELEADITQMRKEGYGWGQICHEVGVHPSVLGKKYGHMNTHQNKHQFGKKGDMSAATARDLKTGWARGHGKSVSGKNNGKGKADSFGIDNNGKAKGKSNGKGGGKGGGKGNGKDK